MTGTCRWLAGAAALACLLGAATPAGAKSPVEITRAARVNRGDTAPARTYSAPFLAVDPEDENVMVASFAEMRSSVCSVARSRDGGRTWRRLEASPSLPSYPQCFQPTGNNAQPTPMAFGRNHVLYMGLSGSDVPDVRTPSVFVARSTDLGDNWTTVAVRDARGKSPEEANRIMSIAVDRSGPEDTVYVSWSQRVNATPPRPGAAVVAVSTDGGRTFSEPMNVTAGVFADEAVRNRLLDARPTVAPPGFPPPTPREAITVDRFGGNSPKLAMGAGGTLYALWRPETAGVQPSLASTWYLSRTSDRGTTFTVQEAVAPSFATNVPEVRWSPLGGPEGTLHVVYENKVPLTQGDRDIYHQRSTDGGRTWSQPRMLNDEDPKLLVAQFLPSLSVAPGGRVDVVWWDFRNDTGAFLNDVYMTSSSDNGATWSKNARVTDRSIDRRIGPWSNGYDVRQPIGIAATARYTVVGWDDTRNGDPDGQAQDVYSALVQFEALPSTTSKTLVYGLAAVVGLLLAGLVVTVVGFVNRRRTGPPPSARAEPSPEPAGVG